MKAIQDFLAKSDKTIREHSDDLKKRVYYLKEIGYIKGEHLFYLLLECCKHHDDGKANFSFQRRVSSKRWIPFDPEKEIPHNVLSVYYLDKTQYEEMDYLKIASAILYHHDYCDEDRVINEKWMLIDENLLEGYSSESLSGDEIEYLMNEGLYGENLIVLKGLLRRCDYSASGEYKIEYPNDFLLEKLERTMQRWKEKNENADWNELQKFAIENRETDIIAVASTGMGKTEAGLLWIGDQKGFFILPVRTAINAIYDRVREEILQEEKLEERVALLHSEALEYYNDNVEELDITEYFDRGKHLSLPLSISTLDQLFNFVLRYKGYETKLATLSYSKIVIDEIQMYEPDLLAVLIRGLGQIHRLGGKIAIVTATLAPFIKQLLKEDAEIEFKEKDFILDKTRHSVSVKDGAIQAEDIVTQYLENKKSGKSNKILIVCNTIKKAQALYEELKTQLGEIEELNLFHSRYIRQDRKKLEKEIRRFGKTYCDEKHKILDCQNGIWISTSLVEVSLDIDFDYLFTELSELNGLFQRMGRCNRKGVKNLDKYNCFVYCAGEEVKRGQKGFLDPIFYEQSRKALQEVDGLLSEEKKMDLINRYFTMEQVRDSSFMKKYREVYNQLMELRIGDFEEGEQLRSIFNQDIIPKLVFDENKEFILEQQDRLRKIEKQLRKSKGEERVQYLKERLNCQQNLKEFVVSIPKYEYQNYMEKIWERFGYVVISKYEKIPIMDCYYDEKGYYPLNYKERTIEDEMMMC
ncbi:CRISPR-associated helicase Cas3' [Firmicutes bacterium OM04-13BH]|nr:CRISPR-associated helicase Cas3' [Firmicutes bacterium AM10-47]RHV47379.1 CRISPR-associated helicase Cas3' [Firmicutes bacterium OM04-13BH]